MVRKIIILWFGIVFLATAAGCDSQNRADSCERDGDCGLGQACLAGRCQAVACRLDKDCPAGQACADYVCKQVPDCAEDADCESGQICEQPSCQPGCREDRDCGAHERCFRLACWPACQSDSDCAAGRCHPVSAICVECIHDADCPPGRICAANDCRTGCRKDSDCASGPCDTNTWQCASQPCVQRDDCELGQLCVAGNCRTGCESYRDCPAGMSCDPAAGDHGLCVPATTDGGTTDGGTTDGGTTDGGPSDGGPTDGGSSDGGAGDDGGNQEPPRLRIELVWEPVGVDLDLHLLNGPAALCTSPGDCYYANRSPDWGVPGVLTDNPALVHDCIQDCTLEAIELPEPAPGVYTAVVYEFETAGGAASATLRVSLDGQPEPAASWSGQLGANCERWTVVRIHWTGDGPPEFEPISSNAVQCCSPF